MKKMNDVLQRKVLCALLAVAAMGVSVNADATFNCYVGDNNYNIKNTTKNFTQDKERTVLITDSKATQYAGLQILAWAAPGKNTSATFKKNLSIDITNTGSNPKGNTEGVTAGVHSGVFGGPKDKKLTVKSVLGTANESEVNIKAKGNQSVMGIFLEGTPNYNGPQMTINGKNLNVSAESKGYYAHGIYVANNTSDLGGKDTTKLVINSENTVIHAKADTKEHEIGIATYSQGQVEVNGNLEINAANAIVTRGGSTISLNKNGDKTVKINGDILFDYDAATSGTKVDADVSINLNNADSVLNGNIYVNGNPVGSLADVDGMNLNIANGAQWNMTGDSFVNHATVKDGGQIQVGKDVTNFKADEVTLDGGELNASGGNTTITKLNASGDAKVNLDNANLSIAGGHAALSEFNASGTSSLNVSNDAKVDVAGGDATLDSVTTSGTSTLKIGSGARMKSTNGLNINDTSQVILDVGSDVEGDLRLDENAKANVKGSLKGKLLKADGTALSKDEIAETLGISDGDDVKSSMELKKDNQHVKMLVDEGGHFIIQSTDMSGAGAGNVKVSALGTWDSDGNYTAGGDYNANNHNITNVNTLDAQKITLGGKDLQTTLDGIGNLQTWTGEGTALTNGKTNLAEGVNANTEKITQNTTDIGINKTNITNLQSWTGEGTTLTNGATDLAAGVNANTDKIAQEVTNRENADKKLQANIDKEAETRENADKILQENIDKEAVARIAGDQTLNSRINQVEKDATKGIAKASALAALHPLDYDPDNKFDVAAAGGFYKGENAFALGAFYRPNRNVMFSLGSSISSGDNAYNVGVTFKVGHAAEVRRPSEGTVSDILKDIQELKAKQVQLEKENEELKAKLAALEK